MKYINYSDDINYKRFINDLKLLPEITDDELSNAIKKYQKNKDKQSLDKIILANISDVLSQAKVFGSVKMPPMDLISSGIVGIRKAAVKFDFSKNVRFQTYAKFWIDMYMRREIIHNKSIVKISHRDWEFMSKIYKLRKQNKSDDEISTTLKIQKHTMLNIRKVTDDFELNAYFESQFENGSSTTEYGDCILDQREMPHDQYVKNDYWNYLSKQMNKLPKKQRDIIKFRFGLVDEKEHTLQEISEKYNITPERIRQILKNAITTLKKLTCGHNPLEKQMFHECNPLKILN